MDELDPNGRSSGAAIYTFPIFLVEFMGKGLLGRHATALRYLETGTQGGSSGGGLGQAGASAAELAGNPSCALVTRQLAGGGPGASLLARLRIEHRSRPKYSSGSRLGREGDRVPRIRHPPNRLCIYGRYGSRKCTLGVTARAIVEKRRVYRRNPTIVRASAAT